LGCIKEDRPGELGPTKVSPIREFSFPKGSRARELSTIKEGPPGELGPAKVSTPGELGRTKECSTGEFCHLEVSVPTESGITKINIFFKCGLLKQNITRENKSPEIEVLFMLFLPGEFLPELLIEFILFIFNIFRMENTMFIIIQGPAAGFSNIHFIIARSFLFFFTALVFAGHYSYPLRNINTIFEKKNQAECTAQIHHLLLATKIQWHSGIPAWHLFSAANIEITVPHDKKKN
jgi:hypothetical protein